MSKITTCAWCGEGIDEYDNYEQEGCEECGCKPLCLSCVSFDEDSDFERILCPMCPNKENK